MKNIFNFIDDLDKWIKDKKFYLKDYPFEGNSNFDFQSSESPLKDMYRPFSIGFENITNSLKHVGYDFEAKTSYGAGYIKNINNTDYYLLSNYGSEDWFYDNFLHTGIYFSTCLLSTNGHLIIALYSKNLEPQIFEKTIFLPPMEGKNPLNIFDQFRDKRPYYFTLDENFENWNLSLQFFNSKDDQKKWNYWLSKNPYLKIKEKDHWSQIIQTDFNAKIEFSFEKTLNYIDRVFSHHFNDNDINIFNRADLIFYLVQTVNHFKLTSVENAPIYHQKIKEIINKHSDKIDLLEASIDLRQNKFYQTFPQDHQFDKDYGAKKIETLWKILELGCELRKDKQSSYRIKI